MAERKAQCSVRIHPELRRLRAGQEAEPPAPAPVAQHSDSCEHAPEALPPKAPAPMAVRLRRDGRRPLCFDGLPVVSLPLGALAPGGAGLGNDAADGRLSLYLAADGRIAAQVHGAVTEDDAALPRPRFCADWVADPADLLALIQAAGQASAPLLAGALVLPCFSPGAVTGPDPVNPI